MARMIWAALIRNEDQKVSDRSVALDAGFDVNLPKNITLSFTYSGQNARTAMDNGAWGNLAIRF